ncbi:MAG TPA: zf-HC2 domain-containing protein [Pyrinomonadaceae bacterium]|nr:zf-HC2 domain-containing protein [Pyrinomonadaceae bacterium]
MNEFNTDCGCQVEDVAAYLDGELDGAAIDSFETHLKTCTRCADELRTQRQLLCTLNVAFGETRSFDLPQNFTRVVAAHAESDMSGMRKQSERRRALQLCAILALFSFALLGTASGALVFQPARSFLRIAGSLFDLVWRTIYDAGAGASVIVRMVGRAIVAGPYGLGLFLVLAFVIAISLLPRLIANYHRAQIIE